MNESMDSTDQKQQAEIAELQKKDIAHDILLQENLRKDESQDKLLRTAIWLGIGLGFVAFSCLVIVFAILAFVIDKLP